MRILFWTEWFRPHIGGIEILSRHLISALQARGHTFSVITSLVKEGLSEQELSGGVTIYRLPFQRVLKGHSRSAIRSLIQRVGNIRARINADVVHVNSFGSSCLFYEETASVVKTPALATFHGDAQLPSHGADTPIGRVFMSADWVTAVSHATLEELRSFVPEIAGRSSVVYNALVSPELEPTPLSIEQPAILCVGRVVRDKGFDVAIDAFARLSARFPQARLLIAGDGPEKPALERKVAEQNLSSSVEFLGWVLPDGIPALMNRAAIVLMPSRWNEPFGLVALQAAQMARPVVATRVGGLPEVVVDGQTGLLVNNEDPTCMADALASLLESPETAVRMGIEARRRAHEVFAWEQCVEAYDLLYRKIAAGLP